MGRILRNVCNIVPGGVICFLPSYSYEQTIHEHLKTAGVLDVIGKKKKVFREPKNASDVEQVCEDYKMGAILNCSEIFYHDWKTTNWKMLASWMRKTENRLL